MTSHDVQTAATEPQIVAVPEPAHGAEIGVPLNRLKASPRNARRVKHSAGAIEALVASIRAKGVLQAPVVEIERDGEGAAAGSYLVTIEELPTQNRTLPASPLEAAADASDGRNLKTPLEIQVQLVVLQCNI